MQQSPPRNPQVFPLAGIAVTTSLLAHEETEAEQGKDNHCKEAFLRDLFMHLIIYQQVKKRRKSPIRAYK
jgi:hypothetical protein